jgi:hypothetical protein
MGAGARPGRRCASGGAHIRAPVGGRLTNGLSEQVEAQGTHPAVPPGPRSAAGGIAPDRAPHRQPPKLTPKVIGNVVGRISEGAPFETACRLSGGVVQLGQELARDGGDHLGEADLMLPTLHL